MFFHILKLQRDVYWQFCDIAYAAYPLDEIDSINIETGDVNTTSAINVVAFGEELGHLELMEGVVVELLKEKWEKFARKEFFKQIKLFSLYFLVSFLAFTLRPAPEIPPDSPQITPLETCPLAISSPKTLGNITKYICWGDLCNNNSRLNNTLSRAQRAVMGGKPGLDKCYLLRMTEPMDIVRRMVELMTFIGASLYVASAVKEIKRLGLDVFLQTWSTVPGRVMFMLSCILIILCLPLRLICQPRIEDRLVVTAMFLTPMHFLFFCR